MWQSTWRSEGVRPTEQCLIEAIEAFPYPDWFVGIVEDELETARTIRFLQVDTGLAVSDVIAPQVEVVWRGLLEYAGGPRLREYKDLHFYYSCDCHGEWGLDIGFNNGPEPVFLWRWQD